MEEGGGEGGGREREEGGGKEGRGREGEEGGGGKLKDALHMLHSIVLAN